MFGFMSQPLQKEREVFEANIEKWRKTHLGKVVLIKKESVIGFFDTLEEAFKKGTELYGTALFFIKTITSDDRTNISFLGKSLRSA